MEGQGGYDIPDELVREGSLVLLVVGVHVAKSTRQSNDTRGC